MSNDEATETPFPLSSRTPAAVLPRRFSIHRLNSSFRRSRIFFLTAQRPQRKHPLARTGTSHCTYSTCHRSTSVTPPRLRCNHCVIASTPAVGSRDTLYMPKGITVPLETRYRTNCQYPIVFKTTIGWQMAWTRPGGNAPAQRVVSLVEFRGNRERAKTLFFLELARLFVDKGNCRSPWAPSTSPCLPCGYRT